MSSDNPELPITQPDLELFERLAEKQIPAQLFKGVSEESKEALLAMSSLKEQVNWLMENYIETNKYVLDMNGRLVPIETVYKTVLANKWSMLIAGVMWVSPTLGMEMIKKWLLK